MPNKNNLTDIWNIYSDSIIKEGKSTRPIVGGDKNMGTKPGPGATDLNSKDAQEIQNTGKSGTTEPVYDIEGVEEPVDPKKKKKGKENLYEPEKYSSEKFDEKVEKSYREGININMKSVFDKLFESVMDGQENEELDALGVDVDNDGDVDVEAGDEVTIKLGPDHVQALKDILAQIEPEDEAGDDAAEDYEEMEEHEDGEDAEEDTVDEATELQAAPDGTALTHPGHNKVGKTKVASKKADSKVKGQQDSGSELSGEEDLTDKSKNKVGTVNTGDYLS